LEIPFKFLATPADSRGDTWQSADIREWSYASDVTPLRDAAIRDGRFPRGRADPAAFPGTRPPPAGVEEVNLSLALQKATQRLKTHFIFIKIEEGPQHQKEKNENVF